MNNLPSDLEWRLQSLSPSRNFSCRLSLLHFFKAQLSWLISWGLPSAAMATAPRTDTARSTLAAGPEHSSAPVCVLAPWLLTPDQAAENVQRLHLAPSPAAGRMEAFAAPAWTWEHEALCAAEDRDAGWGLMRKDASSSASRGPLTPSSPDNRCWCSACAVNWVKHVAATTHLSSTQIWSLKPQFRPILLGTRFMKISPPTSSVAASSSFLTLGRARCCSLLSHVGCAGAEKRGASWQPGWSLRRWVIPVLSVAEGPSGRPSSLPAETLISCCSPEVGLGRQ